MAVTSKTPLIVNGIRLDTLAFNISSYSGRRAMPGKRLGTAQVPGIHGVIPSLSSGTFEPGYLDLTMWVLGANNDGTVPATYQATRGQYDANLDALFRLFGSTDRLLTLRQVMGDGTERETQGRVLEPIAPTMTEMEYPHQLAEFNVGIELPYVFWQDLVESVFTGTASASSPHNLTVTTLTGASAPIEDAIYLVQGPAALGVQLSCPDTGGWIKLQRALTSGEVWRIDSRAWTSVVGGTGMGFDGAYAYDVIAVTDYANSGVRLLSMMPRSPGSTDAIPPELQTSPTVRTCNLVLSGSGFGASTRVSVRARRKFL